MVARNLRGIRRPRLRRRPATAGAEAAVSTFSGLPADALVFLTFVDAHARAVPTRDLVAAELKKDRAIKASSEVADRKKRDLIAIGRRSKHRFEIVERERGVGGIDMAPRLL